MSVEWSIAGAQPDGNDNHRREIGTLLSAAGGNVLVLCMNPTLWSDGVLNNALYQSYMDTYIDTWAVADDYYVIFKLQNMTLTGQEGGNKFSDAGGNYAIATTEPYKTYAETMFTDLATLYHDHPNFGGLSLMNEPYSGTDWTTAWDDVCGWYNSLIGTIHASHPNVPFYLQPARRWGGYVNSWLPYDHTEQDQGKPSTLTYGEDIPQEHCVYEGHVYNRTHFSGNSAWGYYTPFVMYANWNGADPDCPIKSDYTLGNYTEPIAGADLVAARAALQTWIEDYWTSVRTEYTVPVICLEFGIWATEVGEEHSYRAYFCGSGYSQDDYGPFPNWDIVNTDLMDYFYDNNVGSVAWRAWHDDAVGGIPQDHYDMMTNGGTIWNTKGTTWSGNVASNLITPLTGKIGKQPTSEDRVKLFLI